MGKQNLVGWSVIFMFLDYYCLFVFGGLLYKKNKVEVIDIYFDNGWVQFPYLLGTSNMLLFCPIIAEISIKHIEAAHYFYSKEDKYIIKNRFSHVILILFIKNVWYC